MSPDRSTIAGFNNHLFLLVDALSAVRKLSILPVESVSESQLLEHALGILAEHLDLAESSVYLLREDRLCFTTGNRGGEKIDQESVRSDGQSECSAMEGIMGLACINRQIQYCRNCKSDDQYKPYPLTNPVTSLGSLVCSPLLSGESVLGVLNVAHQIPEHFEGWHQHVLILFSTVLGRLMQLCRLTHQQESIIADKTRQLAQALEESEAVSQRYQQLSITDELTGLHNRRYFFTEGEVMLARALRYDSELCLVLIDVDHFKRINDTLGHTAGDRVLCVIARILEEEVRAGDLVARMGGEEFVLLLPNTTSEGADLLAKRIQERIAGLAADRESDDTRVTVSIGMSLLDSDKLGDTETLLSALYIQADTAMYQCKREGRNRRLFYAAAMKSDPSDETPA